MAQAQPSSSLPSFEELCLALNVDQETQNDATSYLERFRSSPAANGKDTFEPYWPICALYVASVQPLPAGNRAGIPLSKLLSRKGFSLISFFEPLKLFLNALGMGETLAVDLEKKFLVMSLLFEKYEQLFEKLFVRDDELSSRASVNDNKMETMFRFGWFLFLMAKAKLLPPPLDFVKALHLLLACINVLLVHAPPALLKTKIPDMLAFADQQVPIPSSSSEGGSAFYDPDTLLYLCMINHANYELVRDIQDRLFLVWLKTLCDNRVITYEPAKLPSEALPSRFYLGGLIDVYLAQNEKSLAKECEVLSYEICDFDEALFLNHNDQLRSPARGGATKPQAGDNPVRGAIPPPLTPARSILAANDWLHRELFLALPRPSPALDKLLNEAEIPVAALVERVTSSIGLVQFPSEDSERKLVTAKLFFHVLEGILSTELQRLTFKSPSLLSSSSTSSSQDQGPQGKLLAPLLKQDMFIISLLAACVEIILATYRIEDDRLKFPASLALFSIPPYEMTKIIECVVKTESRALPRLVVKHLVAIEERILEELGWTSSSPVWHIPNSFVEAKAEQAVFSPGEALTEKFERVVQAAVSPKKPRVFALQALSSPLSKGGAQKLKNRALLSVDLFFRKVAHLAGVRIRELVSEMGKSDLLVSPNMLRQIEYALSFVMTKKSHLFKDRHLDQIILAVVYAICKVNRMPNMNFKIIIEKYLAQPHASPKIYRSVLLLNGEIGDVIKFYNLVFLPELELILLDFESEGAAGAYEETSHYSHEDTRMLMALRPPCSPQKIPTLLVSPRRTPLLFHNRDGPQAMLISIGDLQSPRQGIERINRVVQGSAGQSVSTSHLLSPSKLPTAMGAKKKLDFGLANMDSSQSLGDPASSSQEPLSALGSAPTAPVAGAAAVAAATAVVAAETPSGRRSGRPHKPSKRSRGDDDYEDDDFEASPSKKPRKY